MSACSSSALGDPDDLFTPSVHQASLVRDLQGLLRPLLYKQDSRSGLRHLDHVLREHRARVVRREVSRRLVEEQHLRGGVRAPSRWPRAAVPRPRAGWRSLRMSALSGGNCWRIVSIFFLTCRRGARKGPISQVLEVR